MCVGELTGGNMVYTYSFPRSFTRKLIENFTNFQYDY